MTKAAIVILNYNGRHHLEKFLPKVIQYSGEDCRIFIADNASSDDSVIFLKQHYPSLPLLLLPKNLGFSEGYNEALKQIKAAYYILLNSDIEVTPHWTVPLIQLLDQDSHIAACQPKILSYHNRDCFEYAGAAGGFVDYLGYPFCRGRIFDTIEKDTGQYDDTIPVFWATGACLVIRSHIFHGMGGFDKDFFAHMEEIDLCWRMHLAGHKIYYCGLSHVFHIGGGTLPKSNPHKTYLNFRNGLSMLYKNTYGKSVYWKLFLRITLDVIAAMKFLATDSCRDALAVFRAIKDFILLYPAHKQKKLLRVGEKRPIIQEMYQYSIVKQYFLKKINYFWELKF